LAATSKTKGRAGCYSFVLIFAALALCTAGCGDDGGDEEAIQQGTLIRLADGMVQGEVDGGTRRFLGIPFAAPPVGELRWRPPGPPIPWEGVRDATQFGAACPQVGSTTPSVEENCLYLNVWTPELAPVRPLPVMVWFRLRPRVRTVMRRAGPAALLRVRVRVSADVMKCLPALTLIPWLLAPAPVATAAGDSAGPMLWVINSTDDADDGSCDTMHCSLREAIAATNTHVGPDTIAFNIPASGCDLAGVCTIEPQSLLPFVLDDATIIDGYTQPGASNGNPRVLKIVLNGYNNGQFSGLAIRGANNVIRGLVIQRFTPFTAIDIGGVAATGNHIEGNLLGTDASGTQPHGNCTPGTSCGAVWINDGAHGNVVGPDNLIAYNGIGVWITGPGTVGNTVTANRIHSNAVFGISLLDGGNAELFAPELTVATPTHVSGSACAGCVVELFSDDGGQGAIYEDMIAADGAGNWLISKPAGVAGPYVTATATDLAGNTSQFSAPLAVQSPTPSPTVTSTATVTSTLTATTTPPPTVTPTASPVVTPSATASITPTPTRTRTATMTPSPVSPTATRTATASVTPSVTASVTPTRTRTATGGPPPMTPTPTATSPASCPGDCDGNEHVSIADLVLGVRIALGDALIDRCQALDRNDDERVSIDELILAVNKALNGCS